MKKRRWILWGSLMLLLAAGVGSAYAMEKVSFFNEFVFGQVEIHVEGSSWEETGQSGDGVLPGQCLVWTPQIHNRGEDCYVRVKLQGPKMEEYQWRLEPETAQDPSWILAEDGYYYCPWVLEKHQVISLRQTIRIPISLPQEKWEGQQTRWSVRVEAVQSRNVTPNLSDADPWGQVQVLEHKSAEGVDVIYMEPVSAWKSGSASVVWKGEGTPWIQTGEPLFAQVTSFLPGDRYEDELTVTNREKSSMDLYLGADSWEGMSGMDVLVLKIYTCRNGEKTLVYQGDLALSHQPEGIRLLSLSPDETVILRWEIQIPEWLDNSYASRSLEGQWQLWAVSEESSEQESDWEENRDGNQGSDPFVSPDVPSVGPWQGSSMDTGDKAPWMQVMMGLAVSAALGILARYWKKKERQLHEER